MQIYDAPKIIPGLIIFLGLITFPIYYGAITEKTAYRPEPEILTEERQCVEPTEYMRVKHTDLLAKWKGLAVRQGTRTYISSAGKEYPISLAGTCMGCHQSETRFCAQCHNYVGVKLNCWNCHTLAKETIQSNKEIKTILWALKGKEGEGKNRLNP